MYICIIKQMQVMYFWIFNLEYSCKKKKLSMLLFIQNSINPIALSTYPFIGSQMISLTHTHYTASYSTIYWIFIDSNNQRWALTLFCAIAPIAKS